MRGNFVFSEVLTGLRRNITMTIAMILTTAVSLLMLGGGLLVINTLDKMEGMYYSQAEIQVYLTDAVSSDDTTCSQDPCAGLRSSLENNPGVESVQYESREHGYQRFQKLFKQQPELLKLTREKSIPAALHVNLKDPSRTQAFVQQYSGKPGVSKISDQKDYLKKLFDRLNTVRDVVLVVALIQAAAAVLLISNTIQLSAFNRRKEVGIMRLVGATRWYTQLPFLLEAVVTGIIGAVLAIGMLVGGLYAFIDSLLSGSLANVVPAISVGDVLGVAPWLVLVAIVVSAVTGYGTLRLYVRL